MSDVGEVGKFHSAIRWGKEVSELEPFLSKDEALLNAHDDKNGNQALHIAAQNGHLAITKWLISKGAEINGKNGKDNTALHMSIGYDFYKQTDFLIEAGADKNAKNADGNEAIFGIDGDKTGPTGYGGALYQLAACETAEEAEAALDAVAKLTAADVDKAALVQMGMKKKKGLDGKPNAWWPSAKFMEVAKKF